MKRKIAMILLSAALATSVLACGSTTTPTASTDSTAAETETESPTETETTAETKAPVETETETQTAAAAKVNLDIEKCAEDLKAGLQLEPDYSFVRDYYIGLSKDDDHQIIISIIVDDYTDPTLALDFADTVVRQLNLYAQMQDGSIEPASMDFYGGLYTRYSALVGVAPASKTNDQSAWFVYDGIVGGKVMLKLNKQYR